MPFQFKQFSISDEHCSMKVGVDAVLMGAWCNVDGATRILDIGTGSGVIALMLAQRSPATIHAIDIEQMAAAQASWNALGSPWPDRISVGNISLQQYILTCKAYYDLVVCNPPFFNNSLLSPAALRNQARHSGEMPHAMLARACAHLTTPTGQCCVILPVPESVLFKQLMKAEGFYPARIMLVSPKPGKTANRAMIQFERGQAGEVRAETLNIRSDDNEYSDEYKELTRDFYLKF